MSTQNHQEFVDEALNELLATGRVVETTRIPHIVNPLPVSVQRNGKKRLILYLRHVNKHVYKDKIKFDDWKTMEDFVVKQGFMFKFDIKHGYHHIEIDKIHKKKLGFSWEQNGSVKYFVFTVLPFGLTSAPFIFTKTMRVLVKYWREQAVKIASFIDDGAGVAKVRETTIKQASFVRHSLRGCSYGGELARLTEISLLLKSFIKITYVHMRSEPARFAAISVDSTGISVRPDEIFSYERYSPVRRDRFFNSAHASI